VRAARLLVLVALLPLLGACAVAGEDPVVARFGEETIRLAELEGELARRVALKGETRSTLPPDRAFAYASQTLRGLADLRICESRAGESLRARARAGARAELERERARAGSEAELDRRLAAAQLDRELFLEGVYLDILLAGLLEAEGAEAPSVEETELRALYDEDPAHWGRPEEADLQIHLFRERGGAEVRALTVRRGSAPRALEYVAFETPVGELSPRFRLGGREAAARTLARRPAEVRPFEEVREAVEREALRDARGRQVEARLASWREEAGLRLDLRYDEAARPLGERPGPAEIALVALLLVLLTGALALAFRRAGHPWPVAAALLLGVLLRFGLWSVTPHDWLAHDVEGHLAYVEYLEREGELPPPALGFQFYQPPLYHALGAGLQRVLGTSSPRPLQDLGLLLSVLTLAAGLWAVAGFAPGQGGRQGRLGRAVTGTALALLAVHPSLVLMSPRVNNDVLVTLWLFLAVALAGRWWREGRRRDWIGAVLAVGLGLLTKSTAILLLPVLGLLLILRRGESGRSRLRLGAAALIIVALLAGWFHAHRFAVEGQRDLAGNLGELSPWLALEAGAGSLLTFHPGRVIATPYVNPVLPGAERDHFWEYLFRSSLFGEFSFRRVPLLLSRGLLAAGLALAATALLGLVAAQLRDWREALPHTLLLLIVLAGQLLYLRTAPFSTSQDFRYSVVLLLPLLFFLTRVPRPVLAVLPGGVFSFLSLLFLTILILG
jgi:4-amino-4-deoxy-L-arabinose transferase-like glycosyltransferase